MVSRKKYSRKLDLEQGKPIERQFATLFGIKKSRNKYGSDFGEIEIEYKDSLEKCLQGKFRCAGCKQFCLRIAHRKIKLKDRGVKFFIQTDGNIFVIFHADDVFNSIVATVPNKYMPNGDELFFHIDPDYILGRFDTTLAADVEDAKRILGL